MPGVGLDIITGDFRCLVGLVDNQTFNLVQLTLGIIKAIINLFRGQQRLSRQPVRR